MRNLGAYFDCKSWFYSMVDFLWVPFGTNLKEFLEQGTLLNELSRVSHNGISPLLPFAEVAFPIFPSWL